MRRLLTLPFSILVCAGPVLAQTPQSFEEVQRMVNSGQINVRDESGYLQERFGSLKGVEEALATASLQQQPQQSERSWVSRHPILTGMLIGAGAGAVVGAATCSAGMLGSGYGCEAGGDRAAAALVVGGLGAAAGAFWGAVIEWLVVR